MHYIRKSHYSHRGSLFGGIQLRHGRAPWSTVLGPVKTFGNIVIAHAAFWDLREMLELKCHVFQNVPEVLRLLHKHPIAAEVHTHNPFLLFSLQEKSRTSGAYKSPTIGVNKGQGGSC